MSKKKTFFLALTSFLALILLNLFEVYVNKDALLPIFRFFESLSIAALFYLTSGIKSKDDISFMPAVLFLFSVFSSYRFMFFYANNINEIPFLLAFAIILLSIAIFYLLFFFFKVVLKNQAQSVVLSLLIMWLLTADIQDMACLPAFFGGVFFFGILILLFIDVKKLIYFLQIFSASLIVFCILTGFCNLLFANGFSDVKLFKNFKKNEFNIGKNPKRDIYIILFDMYSGDRTLKELGFDNSEFYNALEDKGFIVYKDMESNYTKTVVSVSSFLNFSYVEDLEFNTPAEAVSNAKMFRTAKKAGYKIYYLNSWLLDFDVHTGVIDEVYESASGAKAGIFKLFLGNTIISKLFFNNKTPFGDIMLALDVADSLIYKNVQSGNKLVFAHLLMPHVPYLYNEFGGKSNDGGFDFIIQDGTKLNDRAYLGYLKFANTKAMEIVDKIFSKEGREPIIIIMGDHGPRTVEYLQNEKKHKKEIQENCKYYFNTFLAYYNPDLKPKYYKNTKSLVNFSINFMNENFGVGLDNLKDEHFYILYILYIYVRDNKQNKKTKA